MKTETAQQTADRLNRKCSNCGETYAQHEAFAEMCTERNGQRFTSFFDGTTIDSLIETVKGVE